MVFASFQQKTSKKICQEGTVRSGCQNGTVPERAKSFRTLAANEKMIENVFSKKTFKK